MIEDAFHCRLFVILARQAPIAAVLRRGPSRWVQLSAWDMATDQIEPGQWFHGRIYERRCDLSPDGHLFLYFAQKKNRYTKKDPEYTYAWTAISKLPYLTALALWPKGNCWHGGGLFTSQREVWLNHRPEVAHPHPAHKPEGLTVISNPDAHGEDAPIYRRRRLRDGWTEVQTGSFRLVPHPKTWEIVEPEVWTKPNRAGTHRLTERLVALEYNQFGGPLFFEYSLQEIATGAEMALGPMQWADWDHRDRLVFARGGALLATEVSGNNLQTTLVADLNDQRASPKPTPEWARHW